MVTFLAWLRTQFWTWLIFLCTNVLVTNLLVYGILISTSVIFVLKTVMVSKPLYLLFFCQELQYFSANVFICIYWFIWTKVVASWVLFFELFNFVFSVLNFGLTWALNWKLHYLIHHLIILSPLDLFSIYQHLNHLLLSLTDSIL